MEDLAKHIEQVYNSYSKKLYFTALRILGNSQEAEDAMQETVLKYYTLLKEDSDDLQDNLHSNSIENLGAWLTSVCVRKALDMVRSKNRKREREIEQRQEMEEQMEGGQSYGSVEQLESSDEQLMVQKIKRALPLLKEKYRVLLSIKLFEGYDYEEIADITKSNESSVRSRFMRGKEKLVELLKR